MPKRTDINKVLIIGSGPIIIGQACEFDYSGTQACKALRKLGYEIVLVNSNPATIMTDPETADETYIEPLNAERLEEIIAKERPDALLPNLGGQSGLNLCEELYKKGILDKYNVKVIGVQVDSIERGEDRIEFKKTMDELGIEMARSEVAYSVEDGLKIADELGYPVVLRPAYTMGGAGGGLVYNKEELKTVIARGLQASLVGQVLVEESILGWEELELEVVRDAEGNMITVCFIENIDPLGVHTGDSFCSAPMLTISEECQQRLQEQAYKIVDSVQVIGGTNVQFAHDPVTDRIIVIEINPRTSRSSALASKATGFPIALVSAMLAAGLTLKDIPCGKYGTLDKYVPDGDYVVIKFARWAFEKFKGVEDKLGTQMRAVGEVMSIGKTYKEAFQKAIRSLETGRYGLGYAKDYNTKSKDELLRMLAHPSSDRHFIMYEALRKGATVDEIFDITKVKHYFVEQMKELVEEEEALAAHKGSLPSDEALTTAKKDGFSDRYLSQILEIPEEDIRNKRIELGVTEAWEGVHVSGTKDSAYYYSTYNAPDSNPINENKPKVMILGGGPNRIGQGIEFDYCCVHASLALKKQMKFEKRKLQDYPQYEFSYNNNTLKRVSNENKDRRENFIIKPVDGERGSITFFDFTDYETFSCTKMGVLYDILNALHDEFGKYIRVKFKQYSIDEILEYKRASLELYKDIVKKEVLNSGINIVDAVHTETSEDYLQDVADGINKIIPEAKCSVGKRLSKKKLNVRYIHDKSFYSDSEVDPHQESMEDYVVQHITVENFKHQSSAAVYNILKELVIKKDIAIGKITLVDWSQYGYKADWLFGVVVDGTYYFMTIHPDGSFKIEALKRNLFSMTEYDKYMDYFGLNEENKNDYRGVIGLVKDAEGNINLIKDTNMYSMPDYTAMGDVLKNVASEGRFPGKDVVTWLRLVMDTTDKIKVHAELDIVIPHIDVNAEYTKANVMGLFKGITTKKEVVRYVFENTGIMLYAYLRGEEERREYLSGNIDINYFDYDDTHAKYSVGEIGNGMKYTIERA